MSRSDPNYSGQDFDKAELQKLEDQLLDVEGKIRTMADTFRGEALKYGNAKGVFEIANANALLAIYQLETNTGEKNTELIRKAKALKQCENEYLAYKIAETEAESSKEVLRALLAQLTSIQSRCGLFKAEIGIR